MTRALPRAVSAFAAPRPLFVAAIALAAGIAAGRLFAPAPSHSFAVLLVALAVVAAVRRRAYAIAPLFILGVVLIARHDLPPPADSLRGLIDAGVVASGAPASVAGYTDGPAEASPDASFVDLDIDELKSRGIVRRATGRIRLTLPPDAPPVAAGRRIRVSCLPMREDAFLNPGVPRRREVLNRLGIDATCVVKSPLLIELYDEQTSWGRVREAVNDVRVGLSDAFRARFSPPTAGVLIASMLGNKYYLDKPTAEAFREGGTFHILVISGLHVTFVGGLALVAAGVMTRRRGLQFAVVAIVVWTHAVAVGGGLPVVRASAALSLTLLGRAVFRRSDALNVLGACALVFLVAGPAELFAPSFQLTFASIFAIVGVATPLLARFREIGDWRPTSATPFPPRVSSDFRSFCETLYWDEDSWRRSRTRDVWSAEIEKRPFPPRRRLLRAAFRIVFEGIVVSLVVQAFMLPFSVFWFNRATAAPVVLNLWVGPALALESFAALAAVAFGLLSDTLAAPFAGLAEVLNGTLATPAFFADLGGRQPVIGDAPGALVYGLYFALLLYAVARLRSWRPCAPDGARGRRSGRAAVAGAVAMLAIVAAVIVRPPVAPAPDGRLRVDFLDVGQGDSILVTFPDGRTLLVDGGGRPDFRAPSQAGGDAFAPDRPGIGETVVSRFLWHRGLRRIDFIAATHADADHIQGLADVAANFEVGAALFGRMPEDDPDFAALSQVLARRGIPSELLARGDRMEIGGAFVEVLWPDADASPEAASDNDHSLVLRISFGARSFLLTGDIERRAERRLLAGTGGMVADVVKVAHHGSRTSSTPEFVEAAHPSYAIISVGRRSRFGHPHAEIVERWRKAGAATFATGERGTVTVSTDGRELLVERYLPP